MLLLLDFVYLFTYFVYFDLLTSPVAVVNVATMPVTSDTKVLYTMIYDNIIIYNINKFFKINRKNF